MAARGYVRQNVDVPQAGRPVLPRSGERSHKTGIFHDDRNEIECAGTSFIVPSRGRHPPTTRGGRGKER
jgi:hypothetical protein